MPAAATATAPSVYLDTCCYQRPADLRASAVDERVRGEAEAVLKAFVAFRLGLATRIASSINWYEAGLNRDAAVRDDVLARLAGADRDFGFDRSTADRAADFGRNRAQGRQRGRDCDEMHLACALDAAVDVFCTVDDRLRTRALRLSADGRLGSLRIMTPAELVAELESVMP